MSANLNEFSSEQLQVLLNVVVGRVVDLEQHCDSWEMYFGESISYTYKQHSPEKCKEHEILQLFRVQILNAIAEVRMKEDILSS